MLSKESISNMVKKCEEIFKVFPEADKLVRMKVKGTDGLYLCELNFETRRYKIIRKIK